MARLIDSLSISYFKIKSKLTFIYFFIILSDISAIGSDLRSFFAITFYIIMFTMMNTVAFFSVRAPRTALFQYVNGGSCQSISYSSPLSKSLSLSETLQIRVSQTWKIINRLSIAMISVTVVPSFIHSHLPKSESFWLRWRILLITLCVAEWQPHWGVLKGSWLSNQFESYLWPLWWQELPMRVGLFSR